MDFRYRAACRDTDPELFFPVGSIGPALLQLAEAKAVCARCEVTAECLDWALGSGVDSGVCGGLTAEERRGLRRVAPWHGQPRHGQQWHGQPGG
jgi:WhiB family redox-sensing transcriptional regulator